MEIILKANVPHLGKMLDVVKVKDGYARNFLFPRKLAVRATKEAKLQIETNRAALEAQFQKELAAAGDIADAITKAGVKVTRAQVELAEPIKQVGVFTVTIKVFGDVEAQVKVWVVAAK